MLFRSLVFLVLISHSLAAQQKVSEICAAQKVRGDSIVRAVYGDTLFYRYIEFDTNSYAWTKNRRGYTWNQSFHGDTILYLQLWYRLRVPGAISTTMFRVYTRSPFDELQIDTTDIFRDRCITVKPDSISMLTESVLKKPLSKCAVSLYTSNTFYGNDTTITLRADHVYLEVSFYRQCGSRRRYGRYYYRSRVLLIDACTGEAVGKRRKIGTHKRQHW